MRRGGQLSARSQIPERGRTAVRPYEREGNEECQL